jgi:AcrR family transcriptional regulator
VAPRALNPAKHAAKRDEFIEAGQRLIQTKGYEQFSVEDLLSEVGASKGAFYHYFDSKQALLTAVIDRMADTGLAIVQAVVEDPALSAVEKLQRYFSGIGAFKTAQADFVLQLMKVWYSDDNAITRERFRRLLGKRVTPPIARIIRQGVAEGTFTLADPDEMARVVLSLILDATDEAGELWFAAVDGRTDYPTIRKRFGTYNTALQRLLGVPPGAFELIADDVLRFWFEEVIPTANNPRREKE